MSFKLAKLAETEDAGPYGEPRYDVLEKTGKLRGNVVIGRYGQQHLYDDRTTTDRVDVDEFVRVPKERYNRKISRNHLMVSENSGWDELVGLDFKTEALDTGQMGFDVWDLNTASGTEIEGYVPESGNPIYNVGDVLLQIQPMNHYLGLAGYEKSRTHMGFQNNIDALAENLEDRGFESKTVGDASWAEIESELERLEHMTEEDSNTVIMYSGHGTSSGRMCLDDRKIEPTRMISEVSELDGQKVLVLDQCFAGSFAEYLDYEVPDDLSVYMASGPDDKTYGDSVVEGETRTRYAGRIAERLSKFDGPVSMDTVHTEVANVGKVGANNPVKLGSSPYLSETK